MRESCGRSALYRGDAGGPESQADLLAARLLQRPRVEPAGVLGLAVVAQKDHVLRLRVPLDRDHLGLARIDKILREGLLLRVLEQRVTEYLVLASPHLLRRGPGEERGVRHLHDVKEKREPPVLAARIEHRIGDERAV